MCQTEMIVLQINDTTTWKVQYQITDIIDIVPVRPVRDEATGLITSAQPGMVCRHVVITLITENGTLLARDPQDRETLMTIYHNWHGSRVLRYYTVPAVNNVPETIELYAVNYYTRIPPLKTP